MMLLTPTIPSLGAFVMSGCYTIPAVQTDITGVFTNKMRDGRDPRRRAARGDAHDRGRCVDQLAAELGMDPLELRRKNFIPTEDFPAETAVGVVYDSGNYHGHARQAARAPRPAEVPRASRTSCARRACYRGVGFSTYTEICGLAPSRVDGPERASACRPASGSRRSCACTSPAR